MPPSNNNPDLTGLHILLVEDSPDIGELMKALLEIEGATVAGPAATTRNVIDRAVGLVFSPLCQPPSVWTAEPAIGTYTVSRTVSRGKQAGVLASSP
jgi:CheY-like chemotaxis protein